MTNDLQPTTYSLQTKKGFTLIEILVVVGIIVVISLVGMASYRGSRSTMVLDLETDRLVSTLQSMRNQSKAMPNCIGMEFAKNTSPARVENKYLNSVDGCDIMVSARTDFRLSQEVNVSKISLDNAEKDNLAVKFIPPNGGLNFTPNGSKVSIQISLGVSPQIIRTVEISRDTGVVEKLMN